MLTIKNANLTINVKDMDKSVVFYQSIGFKLQNRWGNHYAQLAAPEVVIGLHPLGDSPPNGGSGNISIGFTTDNLDEARSQLNSLSIQLSERKEEGGEFLHFADPDGTQLYFIKPKW